MFFTKVIFRSDQIECVAQLVQMSHFYNVYDGLSPPTLLKVVYIGEAVCKLYICTINVPFIGLFKEFTKTLDEIVLVQKVVHLQIALIYTNNKMQHTFPLIL